MPQPLRTYSSLLTGLSALDERPALAHHIAEIALAWTLVEMRLGLLLATLLRTESEAGAAMYLALSSATAKYAALQGAAEMQLNRTDTTTFEMILKKVRRKQRLRNEVVHGLWAITPDHPDALILSNSNEQLAELAQLQPGAPEQFLQRPGRKARTKATSFWIWKERDFTKLVTDIGGVNSDVFKFTLDLQKRFRRQKQ